MASDFLDGIHADPALIVTDGNNLVSASGELKAELDKFDENIVGLMGVWTGDAAKALNDVYNEFKPELKAFRDMLESKGNALKNAGTALGITEDENASAAGKLRG